MSAGRGDVVPRYHGENADCSAMVDSDAQNRLFEVGNGSFSVVELQANTMRSSELRSPLYPHLGPYDHYRTVFEAGQNPRIGLQGVWNTTEYHGESSRTGGQKAVESSSVSNGPHKRPDCSDSPRSKNAAAKLRPSGAQSQIDADLQAALDSIFPPPDQVVFYDVL